MSVIKYVCNFSNRLDARRFIWLCGENFYVCDGHTVRIAAAGGWTNRWPQQGG